MGLIFILFIDIDAMGGPKFKRKRKPTQQIMRRVHQPCLT
jgi:hypothetical protein